MPPRHVGPTPGAEASCTPTHTKHPAKYITTAVEAADPVPKPQFGARSQLTRDGVPFMLDIMSGPNAPLATSFERAGWEIEAVDIKFGKDHD